MCVCVCVYMNLLALIFSIHGREYICLFLYLLGTPLASATVVASFPGVQIKYNRIKTYYIIKFTLFGSYIQSKVLQLLKYKPANNDNIEETY